MNSIEGGGAVWEGNNNNLNLSPSSIFLKEEKTTKRVSR